MRPLENINEDQKYTPREEIANCLTHGLGLLLSIGGTLILAEVSILYGDDYLFISCLIYGISLMALFLSSSLYHGPLFPKAKRIFKVIDHACIYLLIAGTYTPIVLTYQRDVLGLLTLGLLWLLAIMGVVLKIFFTGQYRLISTTIYLVMGWAPIFTVRQTLMALFENGGGNWILVGGVLYTLGTFFYLSKRIPFNHAIWHLFVLSASIAHFYAILFYVIPIVR